MTKFPQKIPKISLPNVFGIFPKCSTEGTRSSGGLPEVFLDVIQFFPGQCPPLCGLLADNFERMPAAALRDFSPFFTTEQHPPARTPSSEAGGRRLKHFSHAAQQKNTCLCPYLGDCREDAKSSQKMCSQKKHPSELACSRMHFKFGKEHLSKFHEISQNLPNACATIGQKPHTLFFQMTT